MSDAGPIWPSIRFPDPIQMIASDVLEIHTKPALENNEWRTEVCSVTLNGSSVYYEIVEQNKN